MHHITPFAAGGTSTLDNLALRCATHNAYAADGDFGAERMDLAIQRSRDRRRGDGGEGTGQLALI